MTRFKSSGQIYIDMSFADDGFGDSLQIPFRTWQIAHYLSLYTDVYTVGDRRDWGY